jgi:hypothetical protein
VFVCDGLQVKQSKASAFEVVCLLGSRLAIKNRKLDLTLLVSDRHTTLLLRLVEVDAQVIIQFLLFTILAEKLKAKPHSLDWCCIV